MARVIWGTAVETLCERLDDLRWRRVDSDRFVVHVARKDASPLVAETAHALTQLLVDRVPGCRVDVIDPTATPGDWPPHGVLRLGGSERHRVDVARLRGGAAVPALWLEPFSLITVAGAVPDVRLRLCAVLSAQGSLLDVGEGYDLDVLFEAHRLMASDLAITCGSVVFGDAGSGAWWAASDDDVALEAAVARAAGVAPDTVPQLRHLARHESVDLSVENHGEVVPRLQGYVASAGRTRAARLVLAARHMGRSARQDLARASENLHRIPQFVARRWSGEAS